MDPHAARSGHYGVSPPVLPARVVRARPGASQSMTDLLCAAPSAPETNAVPSHVDWRGSCPLMQLSGHFTSRTESDHAPPLSTQKDRRTDLSLDSLARVRFSRPIELSRTLHALCRVPSIPLSSGLATVLPPGGGLHFWFTAAMCKVATGTTGQRMAPLA